MWNSYNYSNENFHERDAIAAQAKNESTLIGSQNTYKIPFWYLYIAQ